MLSLSREVKMSIERAAELSKGFNNIVSDDMILLAFLTEEGSLARTVLEDNGITYEAAEKEIKAMKDNNPGIRYTYRESSEEGELTPNAVKVIEASDEIARVMNDSEIGTHHVLISMLMHDTVGHKVISNLTDDNKLIMNMLMDLGVDLGNSVFASKTSIKVTELPKYATDLCKEAREGRLDPLIGRQEELDRITQILCRKTKNNPVLLGDSGVGKTVIIEGLAQRIVDGNVPVKLRDKQIWSLNVGALIAGAKYRGEFEERIQKIMKEIAANPGRIILFIDETHTVMGCGSSGDGNLDMSNMLKPALARGEMQMVGATTIKEYRQNIEPDAAFARRLQTVNIEEPSKEDTIKILKGIRETYEKFHKVFISDEMIEKMVDLSTRYITDRHLPDKAIDLMDEAAAKVNIFSSHSAFEKAIKEKEEKKMQLLMEEKYDELLEVDAEIIKLAEENKEGKLMIDEEVLANIIEMWTKIPVDKVLEDEAQQLLHLEDTLRKKVVGQEEALLKVSDAIRMSRAGLNDPTKPLGSFLFCGPTGTGKTALAKAIAEIQFGSEDNMIRLDMAEFRESHTISKLIGSPAGYVGHNDGGGLTEAVRKNPYTVVLFDEIEKAHPDVLNILLGILDDGRLTDSKGVTCSFKNTIVIMTSNIGSRTINPKSTSLGFNAKQDKKSLEDDKHTKLDATIREELKKALRPELLNRIDEIVTFRALTPEVLKEIVVIMTKDVKARLKEQEISMFLADETLAFLSKEGMDLEYGARPIARAIKRELEKPLSIAILKGDVKAGEHIEAVMNAEGTAIEFKVVDKALA